MLRSFFIAAVLGFSCASPPQQDAPPIDQPYVLVLGTAQDGGLPQLACKGDNCQLARKDPSHARLVSSILLVDPRSGKRWLFDATPDLPRQVEAMQGHPRSRQLEGARPPIVDGIFLTHAHMGHYTGLSFLGPEVYGAKDVPTYCTPKMDHFLTNNGPWSLLVERDILQLERIEPGHPVQLAPDLRVRSLRVPHRKEFSDTLAFIIEGPGRSLLFLPDIDKWERWDIPIESVIQQVDIALLDATFFGPGEVPGRALAEIPHPFIVESIERFSTLAQSERNKVHFTHLNHSNPACSPTSSAAQQVRAAHMHVAQDGMTFDLGN
ncbi:MAG: pyrroloquinoline quinone biosynthesis protein B [Candidatus Paceibacteria bacterium]|jgi:pyrroloquinoline quinone biosynthesis protein B